MRGPRADEEEKSETFWSKNKDIENEVDDMLVKLKSIENNVNFALFSWKKKTLK